MKTVNICASKNYDVLIGTGLLSRAGDYIRSVAGAGKAVIITDDIVGPLYADLLSDSLEKNGFSVIKTVLQNGETVKTPENALKIVNLLAENRFTRSDTVFALGGGTIGDLAGFAASVFLRGIRLVQLPTTLLAAVDSSVGGKTAVNLKAGKNLMGSFYQPDLVACDTDTLSTLPDKIFNDGCAEVIKYGVIANSSLFDRIKEGVKERLEDIIADCVSIKGDIVMRDERESGLRQMLNFGHTAAHAIERCSDFAISHGEAVAVGMIIASRASYKYGLCDISVCNDLVSLLKQYKLPLTTELSSSQLLEAALSDKKRTGDTISLVLPERIGKAIIKKVSVSELCDFFRLGLDE